jgi:hypothetical protein
MKKSLLAPAIAVMLFASGCATSAEEPAAAESATTAAAAADTMTTLAAGESATSADVERTADGLPIKGVINDGIGDYVQTTIDDDDQALIYVESTTDDAAKQHFTAEELAAAQKFVMTFVAEEFLDSELNGNPSPEARHKWWTEHQDLFHSSVHDDVSSKIISYDVTNMPLLTGEWREGTFGLAYGEDQPHVIQRKFTDITIAGGISPINEPYLGIGFNYTVRLMNQFNTGDRKWNEVYGPAQFSAAQENGEWKIAGWGGQLHVPRRRAAITSETGPVEPSRPSQRAPLEASGEAVRADPATTQPAYQRLPARPRIKASFAWTAMTSLQSAGTHTAHPSAH